MDPKGRTMLADNLICITIEKSDTNNLHDITLCNESKSIS